MGVEQPPRIGRADAAVVLGAAVWEGGIASPALRRRAVEGARLVLEGHAGVLIASGGVGRFPPSEAALIRDIAIERGVAAETIVLDERSSSTLESAIHCTRILDENGWSSAAIVSDGYHLPRAVLLFKSLGVNAWGAAADRAAAGSSRLRRVYLHLRELMALPWALLRLYAYRLTRSLRP